MAQFDWPRTTLENVDADEHLKIAASIRGYVDTQHYLCDHVLYPLVEILEKRAGVERIKSQE